MWNVPFTWNCHTNLENRAMLWPISDRWCIHVDWHAKGELMISSRIQPLPVTVICVPVHHSVSGERGVSLLEGFRSRSVCWALTTGFWCAVVFAFHLPTRKVGAVFCAQQRCGGTAFCLHSVFPKKCCEAVGLSKFTLEDSPLALNSWGGSS